MLVWPPKDSDEVVKRPIDWAYHASWIPGDEISNATFTLSTAAGMTIEAAEDDAATISQVTLSGGTEGSKGKVLCQVTTREGQTLQLTATILIEAR